MNRIELNHLVPRISRSQFDEEATKFLERTYPQALDNPMPTPIEVIAKDVLNLNILEERLTEDLSILGQMCFTDGLAEIYDKTNDEYREIYVKSGTMIIDPDTLHKRNIGSKRNTIAHECFHWTRHRFYYIAASGKERCFEDEMVEEQKAEWSEEDWMEWQANNIAPRILMPRETIGQAMDIVIKRGDMNPFISKGLIPKDGWIVEQIAGMYRVSKQAAEIRLQELGYLT